MHAREAEWYDEYYKEIQTSWAPWYKFAVPFLRTILGPATRLIELGCGQGHLLRFLVAENLLPEENLSGLDQSKTAVDFVKRYLVHADLRVGDIYHLDYPKDSFQICILMETIEHLDKPDLALKQIHQIIARQGWLLISFPNFIHLPWLIVRILSDLLHRPNWIVRQPIDRIYTVFHVIRLAKKAGFAFERGIGSNYGWPVFYRLERDWMTRMLNRSGLWWTSFHPILVFRKSSS